jgi:hypothetical protein
MLCCCLQITDHHTIQIGDMVMLPCDNPPSECPPHSRCQLLAPAAGGAANQSNRNPSGLLQLPAQGQAQRRGTSLNAARMLPDHTHCMLACPCRA